MSYPRKQTLTPASLAARRRNALKSTGPRTPRGKARVALNSIRHGITAPWFIHNLVDAGETATDFEPVLRTLFAVLQPLTRLAAVRALRYAHMSWSMSRRVRKVETRSLRFTGFPLVRAEYELQNRILRDLHRAGAWSAVDQRGDAIRVRQYIRRMGRTMEAYVAALKRTLKRSEESDIERRKS